MPTQVNLWKQNTIIKDSYVYQGNPSQAPGYEIYLYVGSHGNNIAGDMYRSILYFDLGQIPNDAIIDSATLYLNQSQGPSTDTTLSLYPLSADWSEATVNWGNQPSYNSSYKATAMLGTTTGGKYIDVKNIVQAWVNGTIPNYGFLIKDDVESTSKNSFRTFVSKDDTGSSQPYLEIFYTIPSTGKKQVEYVGNGGANQQTNATSLTISLPTAQTGDFLVAQLRYYNSDVVTLPSGWTLVVNTIVGGTTRHIVAYKFMSAGEPNPVFTASQAAGWAGVVHALRNVKSFKTAMVSAFTTGTTAYPPDTSTTVDNTAFLLLNNNAMNNAFSPPLGYNEVLDASANGQHHAAIRYMYTDRDQTSAEMTSTTAAMNGISAVVVLEPIVNTAPSITISSNANQTVSAVSGHKTITLSGTVTDADNNTVTISATINGKTKTTSVTNTSTAKAWSLSWDVASDNIAQGTYSNIVVTADDGNGGVSTATYTGTITVDKTNPVITITGVTNGAIYQNSVTPTFSATDAGGSALSSVTATLNGSPYTSGTAITTSGAKTLVVTATDNAGNQSQQTVNFTVNMGPTISLTSPTNNQVLTEGNSYNIEGTASDADNGNVVTVKYKINNGPTRALQSGVSNGSTPISFAKNLTYHDKRLWDGSTDVTGADLAENTQHTLHVWVEDDQGGISAEQTRNFTVIWNRPPVISGSDTNLGTISAIPSQNYSATDPEGNAFTFTEYLNGQQLRSFAGTAGQTYTITIDEDTWLGLELDVQHELKVRATDSQGLYSERIYTFTRTETQIQFELNLDDPDTLAFFTCDAQPTRILVTLDAVIPSGASITTVEVTNNALDAAPVWEDATGPVIAGRGYLFTNSVKTATDWCINIRVTIDKGTATERVVLNGFGGAFD